MHDLSLALEVCRRAEEVLVEAGGVSVRGLAVEVGEDAGVEIENFRFCLDALMRSPPFTGTRAELLPVGGSDLRIAWVEVDDGR